MCHVSTLFALRSYLRADDPNKAQEIGLEANPQAYVENLVALFRETRRILKPDGLCFINLGDSYCKTGKGQGDGFHGKQGNRGYPDRGGNCNDLRQWGLKNKDLCLIPHRVALALQADGWYVRSIVWHKTNPCPESVRDRPTKSHEYIFMLSKSPRYHYNQDAIREPHAASTINDRRAQKGTHKMCGNRSAAARDDRRLQQNFFGFHPEGRNKRDVWHCKVSSHRAKAGETAHFAMFPSELIRPCVLAGSRPGDVVLDPFAGSGTVGQVCLETGREFLGIELNEAYLTLIESRLEKATRG